MTNAVSTSSPTPVPTGRRLVRTIVPILFVFALVVAGFLTLPWFKPGQPEFSHQYPSEPTIQAAATAGVSPTPVPAANDLVQVTITDLSTLAQALPPEAIVGNGNTYHLLEPVLVSNGGRIDITGSGRLVLDRGSYIEVGPGGFVSLTHVNVLATGPTSNRGFLVAVGGLMKLRNDQLTGLGRSSSLARGITFEAAQPGSGVNGCVIRDAEVGIFVTLSPHIDISDNQIIASRLSGIQLQRTTSDQVIVGNHVTDSGGDGISLLGGITNAVVRNNSIDNANRYGILVNGSPGNVSILDNRVSGSFDGFVLDNSSGSIVSYNSIDGAQRFGIRLSGLTSQVRIDSNSITNNTVGLYAARGPHNNLIIANRFDGNGENVRLRRSAPNNVVVPRPTSSELESP